LRATTPRRAENLLIDTTTSPARRSPLAGDRPTASNRASASRDPRLVPSTREPHGRNLRKGRCSETGRIYLITTVTHRRLPIFRDLWCARRLIAELRAADALGWSTTWAFVVMPDHLHWLMALGGADLSRAVLRVKSRSAIAIHRLRGETGPLWQKGFHDHAVRGDEDMRALARYVVANPVRAGLVRSVREYPHWDARWL
jgi:REP-associated tyrosine transposase